MIQKLPAPTGISRVETGPVQFGDDWPGYFMRGDNVVYFLMCFDMWKSDDIDPIMKTTFESMVENMRNSLI